MKNVRMAVCVATALAVCACLDSPASDETSDEVTGNDVKEQPGELVIYAYTGKTHMMSSAPWLMPVAHREFKDSNGRITKTIHYRFRSVVPPPAGSQGRDRSADQPVGVSFWDPYNKVKCELEVLSITTHKYHEAGRESRIEHYAPDMKLSRSEEISYHNDGTRRLHVARNAEGKRTHETRYSQGRSVSSLWFDDTGEKVIAIHGIPPKDISLAYGCGKTTDGLACAIAPNRESGPLEDIRIFLTIFNKGSDLVKVMTALQYYVLKMELRDEDGNLVPQDTAYINKRYKDLRRGNRGINKSMQTVSPGGAEQFVGGYELKEWYSDLKPGKYELTVKRRASGRRFSLVSNTISITIEAPKASR